VSRIEGDCAGYDVRSYTANGDVKFIEVKTTRGSATTAFFLSANEVAFAAAHSENCYLYRVFEFEEGTGNAYVQRGSVSDSYPLIPVVFKANLAVPKNKGD
jgi:hypothetical protein